MNNNVDGFKSYPFCEKDAEYNEELRAITCVNSEGGCGFYYEVHSDLMKDARDKWNTRAKETTP